jgi:rieske iron-sulfur protein
VVTGSPTARGRFASRREMLEWTIRAAYGAFGLAFALPALALKTLAQEQHGLGAGDDLVYAAGPSAGQPVRAAELKPGDGVQVFPRGKSTSQANLIELVRVRAGQGAEGLVAYSAICTHLGCVVHARLNPQGHIACPCHASQFDPADGARVVGGPAGRPLPSLPISVAEGGSVVATGPFSGPVGA